MGGAPARALNPSCHQLAPPVALKVVAANCSVLLNGGLPEIVVSFRSDDP